MTQLIEIHTARLLPGTDPVAFRKLNAELTPEILRLVPGLVRRDLAHDPESGLWTDVLRWTSREARDSAMVVFAANPHLHAFAQHLDPATMATITLGEVVELGTKA